ncbi:MAG: hypothetical protein Q4B62_08840 [Clostridiaceae bacterium]|nr:hypothetical protein [Clostridiaceae bacterium]MDO4495877.1 hypothetical protein [Clostridiaceae bacterium]
MTKKIISVLLCLVILFSFLTVTARAEAIALTTVSLAVLATGLLAAGVAVATDQNFQSAMGAIWQNMGDRMRQNIKAVAVFGTLGGHLVARWTSEQWSLFKDWVTTTFSISGANSIPAEFGHLQNVSVVNDSLTWEKSKIVANLEATASFYDIPVVSSPLGETIYRTSWDTKKSRVEFISPNGAIFYAESPVYRLGLAGIRSVNVFSPTLFTSDTSNNFIGAIAFPISTTYTDLSKSHKTMFNTWKLGGTGSIYDGQTLSYDKATQRIYIGSTAVTGTFTGIADYIYKSCIGAGVIGLPIYGDDVIGIPETDEGIGVDVYPQYYPDVGELSPSVPVGSSMDIDIPTTQTEDGTLAPDIPATKTLTPDDVVPRIKTGDITDGTIIDDDITDFPIEDVTVPDIPVNPDNPIEDNKNARKFKFPTVATKKFPFSIPFDFAKGVKMLLAPAAVPEFDYTFSFPRLGINETIHIDLSDFDGIAKISRWFFSALFVIFLIFATKKLIWS